MVGPASSRCLLTNYYGDEGPNQLNDMDRIEHNAASDVAQLESVACDMMSATGSSSMGVENPIWRCARNCAVTVNKHSSLTPPLLGRSIAWLADRRRDPRRLTSCEQQNCRQSATPLLCHRLHRPRFKRRHLRLGNASVNGKRRKILRPAHRRRAQSRIAV